MNRELSIVGGIFGTAISATGYAISTEQIEQIVSIICSVVGVLIVIITSLLIPFIKWLSKAKKDGKITPEELEEGKEIISNGVEEIKDSLDKNKK